MSEATDFIEIVEEIGETLTLYSFSGYDAGSYVNAPWGAPDPDHVDYPATGTAPGIVYSAATSVTGIVQPLKVQDGRKHLVTTPWGEQIEAKLRVYFDNTVTITARDRITYRSKDYWVAFEEWRVDGELVHTKVYLADKVAS